MKKLYCLLIAGLITCGYASGEPKVGSQLGVSGDAEAGKRKAAACVACHGKDGISENPAWPHLAGQGGKYLVDQLRLFKQRVRVNTLMNPQAANLSEQDMQDLAAYYNGLPPALGVADADKEFQGARLYLIGENIYRGGNSVTGVPACMSCHAPNGVGNEAAKFPRLAGQHALYSAAQLRAYRSGARYQIDDNLDMMKKVVSYMTEQEIEAVSEYIAGLR